MVTDRAAVALRMFKHYRNHILAVDGGALDQPNDYLQAMELIEGALHDG